jgi:hypothetical protein
MKRLLIALTGLVIVAASAMSQDLKPLRVQVEYDQSFWLEGEYAIPVGHSMDVAPAIRIGGLSNSDILVGIEGRLYPFGPLAEGFYACISGTYDYQFTGAPHSYVDSESIGVGYRLIVFGYLTGIVEAGLRIPNAGSSQGVNLYEELGIGVSL